MNRNQNERIRNLERFNPGCLGRMVNIFYLNINVGGNRMLTEKPHYEGSPVSRSRSDVSRSCVVDDQMHDKVMVSELGKSPLNRKPNVTPIKMLIAQAMSKEGPPKKSQPSLVAKLMGLDDLPQRHQLGSASCRSNPGGSRSRSHTGSLDFLQKEHDEVNPYKNVFEMWPQSCKTYRDSPQKDSKYKKIKNEKNMALIREKFLEAKRLSTNEKLRQSKQFQDALEVLSSNKDLLLKFLQEPNSLFSQNHNLPSVPPRPDSKRITILKPSKLVDGHMLPCSGKENAKRMIETVCDKFGGNPNQPTRIVVLKPNSRNPYEMRTASSSSSLKSSNVDGFYGDLEDSEPIEGTAGIPESPISHRRDETFISSVLSNGYIGDESSFSKSEVYYAAGNLSDSEVMSPTSRPSWDYNYINRFGIGSPYSSSFSHASYYPESSVCREAKKRLSERWAIMSITGSVQEQRHARRNSSTLGEMLALSDLKKLVKSEENCKNISDLNNNGHDDDTSPKHLVKSNSLPLSSTEFLKDKKVDTKDLTAEKSHNSSFSRLFFPRSRKSSKLKSLKCDDEVHQSSRNIGNNESECVNGIVVKDVEHLPEGSGNENENSDQPSPISILELQLEDAEHASGCFPTAKSRENGLDPNKYNLIDKSPPIGSISRTLSRDYSSVGLVTPVPGKTSRKFLSPKEEEQECFLYVQTLLSAAGINGGVQSDSVIARWHSPESPLDPSLRDKYMSLTDNKPQPLVVGHSRQRHQRSFQNLVFDGVNEALTNGTHKDMEVSVRDCVWGQMKKWISGEERCVWDEDGDGGYEDVDGSGTTALAMQRVVRKEVVDQVWVEHLRLETDDMKMKIEEKLVEQLVDEFVLELRGRVFLAYTP